VIRNYDRYDDQLTMVVSFEMPTHILVKMNLGSQQARHSRNEYFIALSLSVIAGPRFRKNNVAG
jgi:hypothetical protein